jgi:hypothetical protein
MKKTSPTDNDESDGDGYEVGYGKPPRHSRFKPGQSGNRRGRPKGTRNFKTDVIAMLKTKVRVSRDGKTKKISTQNAAVMLLREKALGGQDRALDRVLQYGDQYNNHDEIRDAAALPPDDKAVLDLFLKRVARGAASVTPAQPANELDPSSPSSASKKEPRYRPKRQL